MPVVLPPPSRCLQDKPEKQEAAEQYASEKGVDLDKVRQGRVKTRQKRQQNASRNWLRAANAGKTSGQGWQGRRECSLGTVTLPQLGDP